MTRSTMMIMEEIYMAEECGDEGGVVIWAADVEWWCLKKLMKLMMKQKGYQLNAVELMRWHVVVEDVDVDVDADVDVEGSLLMKKYYYGVKAILMRSPWIY